MNKKATFIMPVYLKQREEIDFFKKSINGILDQSDQDFQVVIVDDNTNKNLYNIIIKIII